MVPTDTISSPGRFSHKMITTKPWPLDICAHFFPSGFTRSLSLSQRDRVDMAQDNEASRIQLALLDIAKVLVVTEDDLTRLGLYLGYRQRQIDQKRTNNPMSVELAGFKLVCDWWESSRGLSQDHKFAIVADSAEKIGKANLKGDVGEILRTVRTALGQSNPSGM